MLQLFFFLSGREVFQSLLIAAFVLWWVSEILSMTYVVLASIEISSPSSLRHSKAWLEEHPEKAHNKERKITYRSISATPEPLDW